MAEGSSEAVAGPSAAAWPAGSEEALRGAEAAARRFFGHATLRPFQRDAVLAWSRGRDSIVTLATGAGKSLCYQLPPLLERAGRWALVVSPLVALMQDQVRILRQRQIPAAFFGSGACGEAAASWSALAAGDFRIVYVSPEFAIPKLAQLACHRDAICLLAVDEAHCISSWGHDFRPQYRELQRLRQALGGVPVMCLTATCTPEVREDIERSLALGGLGGCARVAGRMNRPNLKYSVRPRGSLEADLGELFGATATVKPKDRRMLPVDNTALTPTSSAIVYAHTKARCEEIATWLIGRGVAAAAYHAGIGVNIRNAVHRAFVTDELQVVVATVAFGMGIDKPSIRRVVHYGAVQTLEHYVQQCGRAGRDGDDAECIAFVADSDSSAARNLIMVDFARQPDATERCARMLALNSELAAYMRDSSLCRRVRLLSHFGEVPTQWTHTEAPPRGECVLLPEARHATCQWCDVCLSGGVAPSSSVDFSKECKTLLMCVDACQGMTGTAIPCLLAAGHDTAQVRAKRLSKHPAFGSGSDRGLTWWKAFLPHVRQAGLLQERAATLANGMSYAAIAVSKKGRDFLGTSVGAQRFELSPVPKELAAPSASTLAPTAPVAAPGSASSSAASRARASVEAKVIRSSGVPIASPAELYRRLSHVRLQWQRREGLPAESLISNAALRSFAEVRPPTAEAARQRVECLPTTLSLEILEGLLEETQRFCSQHSLPLGENVLPPGQVSTTESECVATSPPTTSFGQTPQAQAATTACGSTMASVPTTSTGQLQPEQELIVQDVMEAGLLEDWSLPCPDDQTPAAKRQRCLDQAPPAAGPPPAIVVPPAPTWSSIPSARSDLAARAPSIFFDGLEEPNPSRSGSGEWLAKPSRCRISVMEQYKFATGAGGHGRDAAGRGLAATRDSSPRPPLEKQLGHNSCPQVAGGTTVVTALGAGLRSRVESDTCVCGVAFATPDALFCYRCGSRRVAVCACGSTFASPDALFCHLCGRKRPTGSTSMESPLASGAASVAPGRAPTAPEPAAVASTTPGAAPLAELKTESLDSTPRAESPKPGGRTLEFEMALAVAGIDCQGSQSRMQAAAPSRAVSNGGIAGCVSDSRVGARPAQAVAPLAAESHHDEACCVSSSAVGSRPLRTVDPSNDVSLSQDAGGVSGTVLGIGSGSRTGRDEEGRVDACTVSDDDWLAVLDTPCN